MHITRGDGDPAVVIGADDQSSALVDGLKDAADDVAIAVHRHLGANPGSRAAPEFQHLGDTPAPVP